MRYLQEGEGRWKSPFLSHWHTVEADVTGFRKLLEQIAITKHVESGGASYENIVLSPSRRRFSQGHQRNFHETRHARKGWLP